jgi:hypothetical protein
LGVVNCIDAHVLEESKVAVAQDPTKPISKFHTVGYRVATGHHW